jgi:hypothetical protein
MKSHRVKRLFLLLAALAGMTVVTSGQTLQARLDQQTDFRPSTESPVEQLIEVAQRFQVPMGIEWLEQRDGKSNRSTVREPGGKTHSVLELIRSILRESPEHQLMIEDNLLHVFSQSSIAHPFNFLNLQIEDFAAQDDSLYGAEANLCTAINMTLYPELYKNGWAGGYGGLSAYDPDGLFSLRNITFSEGNLPIREILNQIAKANGNALWVVRLRPSELKGEKAHWDGKPLNEYGHSPLSHRWQFIPLAGLSRLAKEQVSLELTIDGFFTAKKFVHPVMMDESLGQKPGNGNGISTSDGSSCTYSISVKEVRPDAVTMHVDVMVKQNGIVETVFSEDVRVVRGKTTEHQAGAVIAIKAFLEAHKDEPLNETINPAVLPY